MSVAVFFLFGIAGLSAGAADGVLSPARRRLGRVFTVFTDIVTAFVAVGAHGALMYLFCDGRFFVYAALLQIVCFAIGRAVGQRVANAAIRFVRKNRQKRKKRPDTLA